MNIKVEMDIDELNSFSRMIDGNYNTKLKKIDIKYPNIIIDMDLERATWVFDAPLVNKLVDAFIKGMNEIHIIGEDK